MLKSKLFDMLVMIKLKLQNTRSEDAFYLLRNISPEELSRIEKVSFLKHRLHEIMKELFWTWTKIIRANSKENKVIYAANFYAEEHFHEEDFSVKKAASYVGMSGEFFIILYKEVTGQGFWDYVTGLRIRRATELLVAKRTMPSEISQGQSDIKTNTISQKNQGNHGEIPLPSTQRSGIEAGMEAKSAYAFAIPDFVRAKCADKRNT